MYNFFINENQINNNKIIIEGQDAKHIISVLRMKRKEKIFISNKKTGNKYLAEIEKIDEGKVFCEIKENVDTTESNIKVTLFQGIPKFDKMEYIIQKAVELGVYNIFPVEMKNCIVKIKDEEKKIARWQAISEASAKQSKRNIIPKIENVIKIDTLKEKINDFDLCILAYENEEKTTIKQVLKQSKNNSNICIVIGPEGGIDKTELQELISNGAKTVSLGKRILRTETASIVVLSDIFYELEL